MYPTHAAVLDVAPPEDQAQLVPTDFRHAVRHLVEAWFQSQVAAGFDGDAKLVSASRSDGLRRDSIRCAGSQRGEIREVEGEFLGDWAWQGWIERPMRPDSTCTLPRRLRTDVQMRLAEFEPGGAGEVEAVGCKIVLTVAEGLRFDDGVRRPSRQAIVAPPCGLMGVLVEAFRLYQGNIEWTPNYWKVRSEDQIRLLYEQIVDTTRTVPLLVCVGDNRRGPPIEPAELGRHLFGTARVVHITPPRLTATLRELIGDRHHVRWNVVHLFRPRFSAIDDMVVHRPFKQQEIERHPLDDFLERLSSYIRRDETFLASPDAIVRERIRIAEQRRTNEALEVIDSVLEKLGDDLGPVPRDSLHDAVSLLRLELKSALKERHAAESRENQLSEEVESSKEEHYRLKAENAHLKDRLRRTTQAELPMEVTLTDPATVKEAVEQVLGTIEDDELVVPDHVRKQVAGFRSALDPNRVLKVLFIIRDVARKCREGHGDGMSPADYFREAGESSYKEYISDTAKQQHRREYELRIERNGVIETVLMGPHISLSKRHRIYWYHDKEAERFIIGHVGDHLPDKSTN